jgi:putative oxidoreductase
MMSLLLAVGRILIAVIFLRGGINKLAAIAATTATMADHGIPYPHILVWGAVALEIGGGLALIVGLFARCAALALFFYTLALALIFHAFWAVPPDAVRRETASFLGHLAMMGGMLYVVAIGAGRYSIDGLWQSRRADRS